LFPDPNRHFFGTARAPTNWNERGTIVPEEKSNHGVFLIERRRAERRILVHVPVEVTEVDGEGRAFTERTFIEDVSDFGCRFSTRGLVQQGDTITVKLLGPDGNNLPGEEPRLFEIMWTARKERGTTVGARLLQGEKLDKIKSLPENGGPKHDAK
jgi:PilZ domain-containing protein